MNAFARPSLARTGGIALLGLAAAVAVAFAWISFMQPIAPDNATDATWRPPNAPALELSVARPAAPYAQLLARPIFWASRRPFERRQPALPAAVDDQPAPVAAPTVAAQPPQASVGGIYISGGVAKALIVSKAAPAGAWLTVGDRLEDWAVATIDARGVTLTNGGSTVRIEVFPDAAAN